MTEADTELFNRTLMLAPAAGSGIGKALADALTADPEFLPAMIGAAKDGLKAERSFWVKTGDGGYLEREPDIRSRIQTLALLLAHMEGEPVKRIIHQHLGGNGTVDPLAALQDSPALLEAARKLLEKAEWKHSGHQAHKRARGAKPEQAAELVEPTPPAGAF